MNSKMLVYIIYITCIMTIFVPETFRSGNFQLLVIPAIILYYYYAFVLLIFMVHANNDTFNFNNDNMQLSHNCTYG